MSSCNVLVARLAFVTAARWIPPLPHPKTTIDGAFLHTDVFEMASAYAFHIAENQPFIDGNKRTALYAASDESLAWDAEGWEDVK